VPGQGVSIKSEPAPLEFGKSQCLRQGNDVTILCVGPLIYEVLKVAEKLDQEGIDLEVIDARFIKPLDSKNIIRSIEKTGNLLTIEENAIAGGFGSAVLEMLAGHNINLQKVDMMGIPNRYITMGTQTELRDEIGLNHLEIERRVRLLKSQKNPNGSTVSGTKKNLHGIDQSQRTVNSPGES